MQITIHRGIDQIGGCITEIATATTRVLIDLGQNLPDSEGRTSDELATKEAIQKLTQGIDAILYTHYHGDHVGLSNFVPKGIKQYIGDVAQELSICKHERLSKADGREQLSAEEVATFRAMIPMQPAKSFTIKDMKITPYWVSHSAYESLMFLIETEGKRILHTGDFREHSYLGKGLGRVLNIIGEVDVLITEGTMLSRGDNPKHERELQDEFAEVMRRYKNVFVVSSSTDMERLATIHLAHLKSKHNAPMICDNFQRQILDIFSKHAALKQNDGLFDFSDVVTYESRSANIWGAQGFSMLLRCSDKYHRWLDKLLPKLKQEQTCVVFSMWGEYIRSGGKHAVKSYCDMVSKFKNVIKLHTSGHASRQTLAKVCTLTAPRHAIIPIHSESSQEYATLPISDELKSKIITQTTDLGDINIVVK